MAMVSLLLWFCAAAPAQSITNLNYNTGTQKLTFSLNNVAPGSKVEVLGNEDSILLTNAPPGNSTAEVTIVIPPPGGTVTVRILQYPTDADGNIISGPPVLVDQQSIDVSY
jgi:hypothetical protein